MRLSQMLRCGRLAAHRVAAVLLVPVAAIALAGCGNDEGLADDPDRRVLVRMTDYEFTMPSAIESGKIEFALENQSTSLIHELVIFRTDLGARDLPVDTASKLDEDGAGIQLVDEVRNVQPGAAAELFVELEAGKYVFACNVDDHYKRGMTLGVTVS